MKNNSPYTKTERNLIYRTALKRLEANEPPFSLCQCLIVSIIFLHRKLSIYYDLHYSALIPLVTDLLLDSLPEFAKYKKPEIDSDTYWWSPDDRDIRIKVLKECIEQTNP